MSANGRQSELEALLRKLSDGDLAPAEAARLNELLRGDPEACERYLNHLALEAGLERECGSVLERGSPSRVGGEAGVQVGHLRSAPMAAAGVRRVIPFPRWLGYALAACVALLATLLVQHLRTTTPATVARVDVPASEVATLVFAEECVWADGRPRVEGQRLPAGLLSLQRGTAVVRFDGGAALVLPSEAELELDSAASARLLRGAVVVRATDGAEGFRLFTPASEVVDLGTEFAVKVERGGATEVHVLEGEVAWRKESAPKTEQVLTAGSAVRFDRAQSSAPRSVALSATGFDETVRLAQPRERPDLMAVYEGFFYDEGIYQPAQMTRGQGWAGPWRLRNDAEQQRPVAADTTDTMRIVHGQLVVPWPVQGGRLGMLELPPGQHFRVRPMTQPLAMAREGITYFSLMTHEPNHASRRPGARPLEGVRLTFRSSADYWGENLSFGWSHRLQPQIQAGADGTFVSPARIPDEQSLLWVGKILRRANGEDEVSLRIYGQKDVLDFAEPATWHVLSRGLHLSAALDLVVLSSTGTSPRIVDELRIGPSWRSVVPIQPQLTSAR